MIHAQLKEVLARCAAGAWGGALEELSGVSELGRVSFFSKVVAFVDPENAGVYDKRVNEFLFETRLKYARRSRVRATRRGIAKTEYRQKNR
jgi:hypothetical protein